jgi:16S rRNA (adenine1518-N6/adenine1519-N6)-dimethyltransferase
MQIPPPKKSLGQHFLFDPNILQRIVDGAGVAPGDRVLEIGPGPGGLTAALVQAGARVWAVEADARMLQHLQVREELRPVHFLHADALTVDYRSLAAAAGGPLRLVANLPYNISGPLLARLLRQRSGFTSMTVMLQKEVADRLLAPPGSRTRGSLGVLAQCFCELRSVLRVAPGSFRPPPKVESKVVRLDVRPSPLAPVDDEAVLWAAVRAGFGQRRKTLRNALAGTYPDVREALREVELSGRERAETLATEVWIRLANALGRTSAAG